MSFWVFLAMLPFPFFLGFLVGGLNAHYKHQYGRTLWERFLQWYRNGRSYVIVLTFDGKDYDEKKIVTFIKFKRKREKALDCAIKLLGDKKGFTVSVYKTYPLSCNKFGRMHLIFRKINFIEGETE